MPDATDRLVVITGGPGSGKTSLIEALAAQGHAVRPEGAASSATNWRSAAGDCPGSIRFCSPN